MDRIYDRRERTWAYIRQPGVSWSQDETSNSSWLSIYRSGSPSVSSLSAFFLRVSSGETSLPVFMLPLPPGCFVICARLGFALLSPANENEDLSRPCNAVDFRLSNHPVTRFLQVADNRCRAFKVSSVIHEEKRRTRGCFAIYLRANALIPSSRRAANDPD